MAPKSLADRLVELRELHGLSQEDAAHRVGIGLRALQRWESGEAEPHKRNLRRLAEAFDVSVAEFFETPAAERTQLDRIEGKLDQLLAGLDQEDETASDDITEGIFEDPVERAGVPGEQQESPPRRAGRSTRRAAQTGR